MSYLVLARKFRPQSFTSVKGQEHVTVTLRNAIRRGRVAHAYVFAGPRGVGKTSVARIFSKALNCLHPVEAEPCGTCTTCVEITQGSSLAVREIDGASHNSVDNVRELIESFRTLPPPPYTWKVYIIDEVHMLSTAAFNALLKSLEEPPPNTIFLLATTELHKIPETVLSRCQQFDFRSLPLDVVVSALQSIAQKEQVEIDEESLRLIARLSEGSMRDAQSLLDRLVAICDGSVTIREASKVFGVAERSALGEIARAVVARDAASALDVVRNVLSAGTDPIQFLRDLVDFFRELVLLKHLANDEEAARFLAHADIIEMRRLVAGVSSTDIEDLFSLIREGADIAMRSAFPVEILETLIIRLIAREPVEDIGALIHKLASGQPMELKKAEPRASRTFPERVDSQPREAKVAAKAPGSSAIESAPLVWEDFLKYVREHGSRVVSEHLRRVTAVAFSKGQLRVAGPAFSIRSLNEKETREKLQKLLSEFSAHAAWSIVFEESSDAPVAANGDSTTAGALESTIMQHPRIRSLQEAFPGSTIESIKTKD